jgi:hypothetical protein
MVKIALVPSNQDHNIGADGKYNEGHKMHELASMMLETMKNASGVDVRMFSAEEYGWESNDEQNMQGLLRQTQAAADWLDEKEEEQTPLALHLHSDAGTTAHTMSCYDGRPYYEFAAQSKQIGYHLAVICKNTHPFECDVREADYGDLGYIFATSGSEKAINVLIEVSTHQHPESCAWLQADGTGALADALSDTLAEQYSDCRYYPETNQYLCHGFRAFYDDVGPKSLEVLGMPVSAELEEDVEGKKRTVQYFERSVMEYWPEDASQTIKLRLLGKTAWETKQSTVTKATTKK